MYKSIIESSVCAQAINFYAHSYFAISQPTIINTLVATQYHYKSIICTNDLDISELSDTLS